MNAAISTTASARWQANRAGTARGITLLEVLIAVGVLSIGLLSLASLIPVGKYQLAEAAKIDRASTIGRAAYRTLLVREWLRPEMWLYCNSTNQPMPVVEYGVFQPLRTRGGQAHPPLVPLVLDPLLIGMNTPQQVSGANNQGLTLCETFPYGVGTSSGGGPETVAPVIPRVTLRNMPGPFLKGASVQMLTAGGADRLFRGTDDLVYDMLPLQSTTFDATTTGTSFESSGTVPALQYITAAGVTTYAIPQSVGDFSWMVAIQPDYAQVFGVQGSSGAFYNSNAGTCRQFLASVIVFQKRKLQPLVAGNATPGQTATMQDLTRGERMVWVDFIGRGAVRLRTSNSQIQTVNDAQTYLTLRTNEWIAVSGRRPMAIPNPYNAPQVETSLHWYQLLNFNTTPTQTNGQWYLDATVVGDDWTQNGATGQQAALYTDENSFSYSDYSDPPTGIGTILTGAVGVYTKTMTLDGSSMWGDR